ncbi:MAG: hypothetical protein RBU37_21520 [Myxococcota bacterium]|jgi:hypothetical protein|nr:hypothetical protein [Myxococcota bacterium]
MAKIIAMSEVLKDPERRKTAIDDAAKLIDDEVSRKKGMTGMLLKGGYSVVRRLEGGRMIHNVLEVLLDEFMESIEPLHKPFRDAESENPFAETLQANEDQAVQALLSVTDRRAEKSKHGLLKKTYTKLRPSGEEHVKQALPGLGGLIDKHTKSSC